MGVQGRGKCRYEYLYIGGGVMTDVPVTFSYYSSTSPQYEVLQIIIDQEYCLDSMDLPSKIIDASGCVSFIRWIFLRKLEQSV